MNIIRNFDIEPTIKWNKILCPICGNPTGPKSQCYNQAPKGLEEFKKKVLHKHLGIIPVYSLQCAFRKDNIWEATINYYVSEELLYRLSSLPGVERVFATKTYTFQVAIAHLFDENKVKQSINLKYKTFIKELQSIENKLIKPSAIPEITFNGVLFPNGQQFKFLEGSTENDGKQEQIINDIIENIDNVSGIKSKKLDGNAQ